MSKKTIADINTLCNKYGVPPTMPIFEIVRIGTDIASHITDEEIESCQGNDFMTAEFCKNLMRCERAIAQSFSISQILEFAHMEFSFDGNTMDEFDLYEDEFGRDWKNLLWRFGIDLDDNEETPQMITIHGYVEY